MPKHPLFLDFETEAIGPRPYHYPPKPVGFAYKLNSHRGYVSWGHHDKNSHKELSARKLLINLITQCSCTVCHNHGFDREVAETWLKVPIQGLWHDTMFLAFLADPYGSMSLKPLAEKHLGMKPEERDAVRDWLADHGVCRPIQKDWGAYICEAPASIVGPYAIGDVDRTEKLFRKWGELSASPAYLRELELTPIVTEMEKAGVRLDMEALHADTNAYFKVLDEEDSRIRRILGRSVDLDKDQAVAEALEKSRKLRQPLPLTEKGSVSVNKRALIDCVKDKQLLGAMLMRNSLATSLRTFMQPWLEAQIGGRLHFRFNQVRNEGAGARTGRMSSSPNMMNVPSKWEMVYSTLKELGYKPHYALPNIRRYLLPDTGDVLASIDYNQQEMRLFAHFEDGEMMRAYNKDPAVDAHQMVADIAGIGRKVAKTLNFAELYGAGVAVIMVWLDCTEQEARDFKRSYRGALPGVKDLKDSIEALIKGGSPITTIGGRDYYPEAPKMVKGRMRDFNYKLLNYLIQGSAADQTKQAMIDYQHHPERHGRLMFSVHDEIVISAPRQVIKEEAELLAACMRGSFKSTLDVPFLTDANIGGNYGEF